MRSTAIVVLFALAVASVCSGAEQAPQPLLTDLVGSHVAATALLESSPIPVGLDGEVELPYEQVLTRFRQGAILADVQEAYRRILPAGEEPEFTIRQLQPGHYFYVNKARQRTDIETVCDGAAQGQGFHVVYHTAGKRFFGRFQALTHVTIQPSQNGVRYTVSVLAYPENGFSRFFIRRLHVIERYFRKKTTDMTALIEDVCMEMMSGDMPPASRSRTETRPPVVGSADRGLPRMFPEPA
jgi:hypothetical protein